MLQSDAVPTAIRPSTSASPPPRDARGREIDLAKLRPLLDQIIAAWRPDQIWLFGSRARGEAEDVSDWDLFAVVPDDLPDADLDPMAAWKLRRAARIRADIIPCHRSDFRTGRNTPNTIAYDVDREGVLIYER